MKQGRAASGGAYISTVPQAQADGSGVVVGLGKAKKMFDDGLITEFEFQEIKEKLLGQAF